MNIRSLLRPAKRRLEEAWFGLASEPKLSGRYQLPSLLNARGLLGTAVEVGVFEGVFSDFILTHWRGKRLISVDPWQVYGEDNKDACTLSQADMDGLCRTASQKLGHHGERSEIWRMTSQEAACRLADGALELVYIDALHHEDAVAADLRTWYPKVRPGGLLAGHDYMDGVFPFGIFGVKTAVDAFVKGHGLKLYVTGGKHEESLSWFLFKPPE